MRRERKNTEILTLRGRKEGESENNQPTPTTNHDRNIRNVQRNPGENSVMEAKAGRFPRHKFPRG